MKRFTMVSIELLANEVEFVIEVLLRPHVLDTALDAGYKAMAADMVNEARWGLVWWVEFDPYHAGRGL